MIAGGGTGGHIYPAIAVAQEWLERNPRRQVLFVGTEYGLEKKLVPAAGFPLEFVRVGGLKGKSLGQTLKNVLRLPLGIADAWRLLSLHHPAAVLGVGGYASGPVLLVAALRGIPTAIHEANAFPGLTNRILGRFVWTIAVGFPKALEQFGAKGVVTGNPVRRDFFEAAEQPRMASTRVRLLLFGGSQGSKILNDTMTGALLFLSRLKGTLEITHQTGAAMLDSVRAAYRTSPFPEARVFAYLDSMATEMASADLIVSRAGAMTVGELAAVGRGAILVPFAAATNNHQEFNARALESAGGAVVITEAQLTAEKLAAEISALAGDPSRVEAMGRASRTAALPDATSRIVELLEEIKRN